MSGFVIARTRPDSILTYCEIGSVDAKTVFGRIPILTRRNSHGITINQPIKVLQMTLVGDRIMYEYVKDGEER